MARIDDIPADQRAVLSLIVRRRKSYAEIAAALEIDEEAVYERAHAALAELAGEPAGGISRSEREQIGDYLLSQQSPSERLIAYDQLEGSASGRAFAQAAAAELSAISNATLPAIPAGSDRSRDSAPSPAEDATAPTRRGRSDDAPLRGRGARARRTRSAPARAPLSQAESSTARAVDESTPVESQRARSGGVAADAGAGVDRAEVAPSERQRRDRAALVRARPSSRLGGAILLAAIVIGVVLAVVLTSSSGGGSGTKGASASSLSATNGAGTAGAGGTGSTGQVHLAKQLKLTPPGGAGSAVGEAAVLTESGKYLVALAAERLPPTNGFFYAAWLYNSPSNAFALGKAPAVSSDGQLKPVAQALPEGAASYHQLIITKETSQHPAQPGEIVLSGPFALH